MSSHCRHEPAEYYSASDAARFQQTSGANGAGNNDGYTHLIDQYHAPEKHFEPLDLNLKRPIRSNSESCHEPHFSRNYGWDEIEQNEEDEKRLRQLLAIWDAERVAILKLQHDLDKNIFIRTVDYIKRIGQSVGLALWLWTHRPANCSNIANYSRQEQPVFTNAMRSKDAVNTECLTCPPCPETLCYHARENEELSCLSPPPLDTLPDSLWLKRFVLDEQEEYLPPIARAMKNMLDNDMDLWNPQTQERSSWPHFVNKCRAKKHTKYLRTMNGLIHLRSASSQQSLPSLDQRQTTRETVVTPENKQTIKSPPPDVMIKKKLTDGSSKISIASEMKPKITNPTTNNDVLSDKQQLPSLPQSRARQSFQEPLESSHKSNEKKPKRDTVKHNKQKNTVKRTKSTSKDRKKKSKRSANRSKSRGQKRRSGSKSKKGRSSRRSKSKKRRSRSRSKSNSRKSRNRSKSKGKKKKNRITARTVK